MNFFIISFFTVFIFNLIPVFSPPTWVLLSYIGVRYDPNPIILALVGALAATAGRLCLARLSSLIMRNHWLSNRSRKNIEVIQHELAKRTHLTSGIFLFYAFSPFPSNYLFIAYGLTELPLLLVGTPFFIGRFLSYLFWIFTTTQISHRITAQALTEGGFIGSYYIVGQLLTLVVIYIFVRLDWQKLIKDKKISLL